jgi:UDP-3-O-[3-hydroxymyristoyl] glucosamine N-acyltransferase
MPAIGNKEWRKTVAHLRNLDEMAKRIKELEKRVSSMSNDEGSSE